MINIIKIQREFFNKNITKDIDFRIAQLKKLKKVILQNEENILNSLKKDLNKSPFESYTTEIGFVINEINYMIKNIKKFSKTKKVKTPIVYFGASSYIVSEPVGIALIIGPWNYPFQLNIAPLVGSIAAGNCSVIKPSEYSPNVSNVIEKIIKENFNENYITVIQGDNKISKELLCQKFDYIFFTGSTSIGKLVMEAASKNLTPVTLELGGKSPCIVDKEVALNLAAKRIAWGKFLNAGQTCVAPDYVLINKSVKEEFIINIKKQIKDFYGDDPLLSKDYVKIINKNHFNRLLNLLNEGNIVVDGNIDKKNLFISPTIIDNVSSDSTLMNEEIFGPILPIIEYENLDDAIKFINTKPKPLALYIFSSNNKNINKIINLTCSGGITINDTLIHMTTNYLPFGGVSESGLGSYHGKASFDSFSHKKSILKNQTKFDLKLKYPPYNTSLKFIKKILNLL